MFWLQTVAVFSLSCTRGSCGYYSEASDRKVGSEGSQGRADQEGARSLDVGEPDDPGLRKGPPLIGGPFLVKVDRYGSVSGLVRVRVPGGYIVIVESEQSEVPYGSS